MGGVAVSEQAVQGGGEILSGGLKPSKAAFITKYFRDLGLAAIRLHLRAFFDYVDPTGVIARLDRAIQYPQPWLPDCPVKPGNDGIVGSR